MLVKSLVFDRDVSSHVSLSAATLERLPKLTRLQTSTLEFPQQWESRIDHLHVHNSSYPHHNGPAPDLAAFSLLRHLTISGFDHESHDVIPILLNSISSEITSISLEHDFPPQYNSNKFWQHLNNSLARLTSLTTLALRWCSVRLLQPTPFLSALSNLGYLGLPFSAYVGTDDLTAMILDIISRGGHPPSLKEVALLTALGRAGPHGLERAKKAIGVLEGAGIVVGGNLRRRVEGAFAQQDPFRAGKYEDWWGKS